MPSSWPPAHGAQQTPRHQHRHGDSAAGAGRAPCLYEFVLREAIAAQHRLTQPERFDLRACDGCGKPYLLASIWQPLSDQGEVVCPRCGAEAVAWDGARGYVAYWQRDQALRDRRPSSRSGETSAAAR